MKVEEAEGLPREFRVVQQADGRWQVRWDVEPYPGGDLVDSFEADEATLVGAMKYVAAVIDMVATQRRLVHGAVVRVTVRP